MNVVGFGHSYGWALKRAAASLEPVDDICFTFPLVGSKALPSELCVSSPDGLNACAAIDEALLRLGRGSCVFASALFGNHHNIVGLLEKPDAWGLGWVDQDITLSSPKRMLSSKAFEAFMRDRLRTFSELLASIAARPDVVTAIHFSSPPPVRSNVKFRSEALASETISDPLLRLALWRAQQDVIESICEECGTMVIGVPSKVVDSDGYLLEQFSEDGVHGNTAFGRLQLFDAIDVLRGAR